jgi:hypothetical protein
MTESSRNASSAKRMWRIHRKLKAWAEVTGHGSADIIGDLAEIHDAAHVIIGCIEDLASSPPIDRERSGERLTTLEYCLNEELSDHIASLNLSLGGVLDSLYEDDDTSSRSGDVSI